MVGQRTGIGRRTFEQVYSGNFENVCERAFRNVQTGEVYEPFGYRDGVVEALVFRPEDERWTPTRYGPIEDRFSDELIRPHQLRSELRAVSAVAEVVESGGAW